jgi:hypothetical protein
MLQDRIDVIEPTRFAFIAVMNETVKTYRATKSHPVEDVERMHRAWCKSMQLQILPGRSWSSGEFLNFRRSGDSGTMSGWQDPTTSP